MTKRDFFLLFIKVVGLFLLLSNVFTTIPGFIPYLTMMPGWQILVFSSIVGLIIVGLFVLLVKKADWLVDALKLDKGFDDSHIELGNPNKNTLIQVTILFIGGYLLVDHIPAAILQLINLFIATVNQYEFNFFGQSNSSTQLIINLAAILVAYLLITNSHRLTLWLVRKSKSPEDVD
jgi:hypothetical protein